MATPTFKKCTVCGKKWINQSIFLFDPDIRLVGYQVSFDAALEAGLLLFNHSCGTTLAVPVKKFQDLHEGPVAVERMIEEKSPKYCLNEDGQLDCPAGCKCADVKEIMKIIKSWPKKKAVNTRKIRTGLHEIFSVP